LGRRARRPCAVGVRGGDAGSANGGRSAPMTGFGDIPDVVLGPLAGRPESDWHRAPPGKWSPAQIVHHLAISLEMSGRTFEERRAKPPMRRRPRTPRERLAYFLVLQIGWMPTGRDAPPATRPVERPDARDVERQFRDGVARFLSLERELLPARRHDLFVKNPVFEIG